MLDIKLIREDPEGIKASLARRGLDGREIDHLVELDLKRRDTIKREEGLKAEKKRVSEEIGRAKRAGTDASEETERMRGVSLETKRLEETRRDLDERIRDLLLGIPNLPDDSIPDGNETANRIDKIVGDPTLPPGGGRPHWDIGTELGLVDFERGAKISGARFYVLTGDGARLERALINYMLDLHTREHGYLEVFPPFLVNHDSMFGTGQFPKFREDHFSCERDPFALVPTAEVPVTNLLRGEILSGDDLPIAYAAYTACFRREAGAAGKETRGVLRVHQFNKVELVRFTRPEDSSLELEILTRHAEAVLEGLDLPYRRVTLAAGDLGASAAMTHDLEVWMPGQGRYVEVSSCSNFRDYQARRMMIRFKRDRSSRPEMVHTLNGSGLAVGRVWAAILENNLIEDGGVSVPEALVPYMGGKKRIGGNT